jgi:hypothetical protein
MQGAEPKGMNGAEPKGMNCLNYNNSISVCTATKIYIYTYGLVQTRKNVLKITDIQESLANEEFETCVLTDCMLLCLTSHDRLILYGQAFICGSLDWVELHSLQSPQKASSVSWCPDGNTFVVSYGLYLTVYSIQNNQIVLNRQVTRVKPAKYLKWLFNDPSTNFSYIFVCNDDGEVEILKDLDHFWTLSNADYTLMSAVDYNVFSTQADGHSLLLQRR